MINLDIVVVTTNILLHLGFLHLSYLWLNAFLLKEVEPCGFVLPLACTVYCENLQV